MAAAQLHEKARLGGLSARPGCGSRERGGRERAGTERGGRCLLAEAVTSFTFFFFAINFHFLQLYVFHLKLRLKTQFQS